MYLDEEDNWCPNFRWIKIYYISKIGGSVTSGPMFLTTINIKQQFSINMAQYDLLRATISLAINI